jgi:hypothetical protein
MFSLAQRAWTAIPLGPYRKIPTTCSSLSLLFFISFGLSIRQKSIFKMSRFSGSGQPSGSRLHRVIGGYWLKQGVLLGHRSNSSFFIRQGFIRKKNIRMTSIIKVFRFSARSL